MARSTAAGALLAACTLLLVCEESLAATFTFVNNCQYTVWPGVLSNAGSTLLANGGFELGAGQTASVSAPVGWSGRFWGRTGCSFGSSSGAGTPAAACATGDCGGGRLQCAGAGAATPATLAEFTLGGSGAQSKLDFYDVSLVDGYNLAIAIVPKADSSGSCSVAGCSSDLNLDCPADLQLVEEGRGVVGCRSACDAFQSPQYCCQGAYGNPSTCKPSLYSKMFKSACPKAYSYAYDDPTSTFTCSGVDYSIVFCPSSSSQKTVTGLEPGSTLLGSQAYASSSSGGDSRRPLRFAVVALLLSLLSAQLPLLLLHKPIMAQPL